MADQVNQLMSEAGTFGQFVDESFDPKSYANTIIESRAIGESLAKLADGISLLDKELHNQVSAHHEDLLSQATGIETLEGVLQNIQTRIHSLSKSVERVQVQVTEPYNRIAARTAQLRRLQNACDILRRVIRVIYLSKRLQAQLKAGNREITKAAQSLNELDHVLEGEDLSEVHVVEEDLEIIRKAKATVESQAIVMLDQGLHNQNQTQTGTALQVFHNLGFLQDRIDELVTQFSSEFQENVLDSLDPQKLSSFKGNMQGPGRSTMPTPGNTAAWRAGLWTKMETLMNKLYELCEKFFHLEKVLAKKKDPVSHICFLDMFSENSKSVILNNFWVMSMEVLADGFKKATQESTFIKQAFEGEYPKLLRVCNDLWSRIQPFMTSQNNPSTSVISTEYYIGISDVNNSPRLLLRESLVVFENAYLSRSLSRLFDPINLVLPSGSTNVPSKEELSSIVKTMSSELNVASVDSDLSALLARNVGKTVQLYVTKCEQLLTTGMEACQLSGGLTNAQILNADVCNSLYQLSCGLKQMLDNLQESSVAVLEALQAAINTINELNESILEPLVKAISSSLENRVTRIHAEDFSENLKQTNMDPIDETPCSNYVKDIQEFVARVHGDYFSLYEDKDLVEHALQPVAARLLVLFVRHASLLHTISESGKLKLAGDMAQMELAVSPFCKRIADLGSAYKLLRAFRPLVFQSLEEIKKNPAIGDTLPHHVVLHFLFTKTSLDLKPPHIVAGWTLSEYSQWLDGHSNESDILKLIQNTCDSYAKSHPTYDKSRDGQVEAYKLMLHLLANALKN